MEEFGERHGLARPLKLWSQINKIILMTGYIYIYKSFVMTSFGILKLLKKKSVSKLSP